MSPQCDEGTYIAVSLLRCVCYSFLGHKWIRKSLSSVSDFNNY